MVVVERDDRTGPVEGRRHPPVRGQLVGVGAHHQQVVRRLDRREPRARHLHRPRARDRPDGRAHRRLQLDHRGAGLVAGVDGLAVDDQRQHRRARVGGLQVLERLQVDPQVVRVVVAPPVDVAERRVAVGHLRRLAQHHLAVATARGDRPCGRPPSRARPPSRTAPPRPRPRPRAARRRARRGCPSSRRRPSAGRRRAACPASRTRRARCRGRRARAGTTRGPGSPATRPAPGRPRAAWARGPAGSPAARPGRAGRRSAAAPPATAPCVDGGVHQHQRQPRAVPLAQRRAPASRSRRGSCLPRLTSSSDFGPDRPMLVPSPPLSLTTTSRSSTSRARSGAGSGSSSSSGRSSSGSRTSPGSRPASRVVELLEAPRHGGQLGGVGAGGPHLVQGGGDVIGHGEAVPQPPDGAHRADA